MRMPTLGYGVLEKGYIKSKKGHNSEKNVHLELSPLIVWITLWIVNTHFEFQSNIFSNNRDITKCQILHDNNKAKAIAIPRVFSENSQAKMVSYSRWPIWLDQEGVCIRTVVSQPFPK